MKMKNPIKTCLEMDKLLDAYHDGELSPKEAGECAGHLQACSSCRRAAQDYQAISRSLTDLAEAEEEGGAVSLWPAIRIRLREERQTGQRVKSPKRFFSILRPVWVGVGLSAAAALIIFFSGVFTSGRLPKNYCRIESISAPGHNLIIHHGQSDGLTIIWLTE